MLGSGASLCSTRLSRLSNLPFAPSRSTSTSLRLVHPLPRGHDWIKKTLTRVYNGGGSKKDVDNVQYLAENMLAGPSAARRRSGNANARLRQEIPQRVRRLYCW